MKGFQDNAFEDQTQFEKPKASRHKKHAVVRGGPHVSPPPVEFATHDQPPIPSPPRSVETAGQDVSDNVKPHSAADEAWYDAFQAARNKPVGAVANNTNMTEKNKN